MMEFIRARWKPVGEGTQESPHAPGVGKPGPTETEEDQVGEQTRPK